MSTAAGDMQMLEAVIGGQAEGQAGCKDAFELFWVDPLSGQRIAYILRTAPILDSLNELSAKHLEVERFCDRLWGEAWPTSAMVASRCMYDLYAVIIDLYRYAQTEVGKLASDVLEFTSTGEDEGAGEAAAHAALVDLLLVQQRVAAQYEALCHLTGSRDMFQLKNSVVWTRLFEAVEDGVAIAASRRGATPARLRRAVSRAWRCLGWKGKEHSPGASSATLDDLRTSISRSDETLGRALGQTYWCWTLLAPALRRATVVDLQEETILHRADWQAVKKFVAQETQFLMMGNGTPFTHGGKLASSEAGREGV